MITAQAAGAALRLLGHFKAVRFVTRARLTELFAELRRRLSVLAAYLGAGRTGRKQAIADIAALQHFLDSRASHVAQTTLYGYLRTRAGTRYPVLFENDAYVVSINHAKWQMWLACLSDLSVFAGGLLARHVKAAPEAAGVAVRRAVEDILEQTGTPADSGPLFAQGAEALRDRLNRCDWAALARSEGALTSGQGALAGGEAVFTESPEALVRHAPIIAELMALDAEIVRNSVRFRWQEVRREMRAALDADAVLGRTAPP